MFNWIQFIIAEVFTVPVVAVPATTPAAITTAEPATQAVIKTTGENTLLSCLLKTNFINVFECNQCFYFN